MSGSARRGVSASAVGGAGAPAQKGEYRLIRIHPNAGGVEIRQGDQKFIGVSPDIFLGLDTYDSSKIYFTTRKLNCAISLNPDISPTLEFLSYLTEGPLEKTAKCRFHGDKNTGLRGSAALLSLLKLKEFKIAGKKYQYDSVGVAANNGYAPVSFRRGNRCWNFSSHLEIKFLSESLKKGQPGELLCLNIHLMASDKPYFTQASALKRLELAMQMLYHELGLLVLKFSPQTALRRTFDVTLENYESLGFSIEHEESLLALGRYDVASLYTASSDLLKGYSLGDFLVTASSVLSATGAAKEVRVRRPPATVTLLRPTVSYAAAAATKPKDFMSCKEFPKLSK